MSNSIGLVSGFVTKKPYDKEYEERIKASKLYGIDLTKPNDREKYESKWKRTRGQ